MGLANIEGVEARAPNESCMARPAHPRRKIAGSRVAVSTHAVELHPLHTRPLPGSCSSGCLTRHRRTESSAMEDLPGRGEGGGQHSAVLAQAQTQMPPPAIVSQRRCAYDCYPHEPYARPDYWHTGVSHCCLSDAAVARRQFKTPALAERSENRLFRRRLAICLVGTASSNSRDASPSTTPPSHGYRRSEQPCPNAVPHGTHGFAHGGRAVGSCLHASIPCDSAYTQSQHSIMRNGQANGIDFRSLSGPLFSMVFGTSPGQGIHFCHDYIHDFL
jgi:hypothetical protein